MSATSVSDCLLMELRQCRLVETCQCELETNLHASCERYQDVWPKQDRSCQIPLKFSADNVLNQWWTSTVEACLLPIQFETSPFFPHSCFLFITISSSFPASPSLFPPPFWPHFFPFSLPLPFPSFLPTSLLLTPDYS